MNRYALAVIVAVGLAGTAATAADFDPRLLLPPPPMADSPQAADEIAELHHLKDTSTKDQLADAAHDNGDESADIYEDAVGPGFDPAKLPATVKLLKHAADLADAKAGDAKKFFHRDRPWIVIDGWETCAAHGPGPAKTSYPSGHATFAFSTAVVLAALLPDHAPAILARAERFAQNRLVCGFHFRSDVVAGQLVGTLAAHDFLGDPATKPEWDAAVAELTAAHLR